MRQIILHTAKAIARDADRKGELLFTDAGTILQVPSQGLTAAQADEWVKAGHAAECGEAKSQKAKTDGGKKPVKPRSATKAATPITPPPATPPAVATE